MSDAESTPISVRTLGKTFDGGTRALDPVDLDIAGGETLALLGPSGCGKTTLLRLIAGLERPDPGGRVLFGDRDVTPLPIEKREVGMVFQSYALFPNMSVRRNIGYGLEVRRAPAAERNSRVDEMLALMRIEDLGDRRIDQLSGGQRQRVALARAIAPRPRALLLDEPLTALDAQLREHLRVEIDALLRSLGVTAIYVTHDQAEAMALADRIAVMSRGRIAQIGAPRDIYFDPSDAFVADFVGITNRLPVAVTEQALLLGGQPSPWALTPPQGARSVMFRPEDARLAKPGEEPSLKGRIASTAFLGDRCRVAIDGLTSDGLVLIDADARSAFAVGDQIGVVLDPARLRFEAEARPC